MIQVHPRPYVYSQWGALQVRLRLWEKRLSHLWGQLHRLSFSKCLYLDFSFPGSTFDTKHYPNNTDIKYSSSDMCCVRRWLISILLIGLVNLLYNFEFFSSSFLICLRGAVTEANKDEQGCLGPKECKYVIMDRYNNYKKPEFSQQARRGSNYQLSVDNRILQETWRVHEQLWGLHSGMLLRPLSTSSSWGENYSFWRPRRRY